MRNRAARIATGVTGASLIGSSLTGAVAKPEQVKQPEQEPVPVEETIPYEQEDPKESESSIFLFEEDEFPSILKEEEKAQEEINKPITEEEIKEVVDEPPSVFGDPAMLEAEEKEEVTNIEEERGFPTTVKEILETPGLYDGEFVGSDEYMPLSDLRSYEVERTKLDEKFNVHTNGKYLKIITVPTAPDGFPEDYFVFTKLNINTYSEVKNQQKREDYYYNNQFENIKGVGFSIDEIITFKGPSGDILEFGKVFDNGGPTDHYILMRGVDSEGQKKDYMSKEWKDLDPREYGYQDDYEFDKFVHMILSADIRENAESSIERWGLDVSGRSGSSKSKGFFINVIKANHEWREGLLYKFNDPEGREELEKIAEADSGVKTVLGFVDAINSYPGDDIVTSDYLKKMYQFNRENYGVEPIGLKNTKYLPETLTKYLLNYRDEEGNSWYDSFLENMYKRGRPSFRDIEELTRELNLLSSGVKIEGQPAQPFVFLDLMSEFTGERGPSLQLLPVKTIREIIPKKFMSSGREEKVTIVRGGWRRAFIYKRGWAGIKDVLGGDLIIYPDAGGVGYDGNSVGQAVKIFYVDDQSDPENPVYWAIDLNDYEGKARVYKWKNIYDPHLGISFLLTDIHRDIDN